MAVPDLFSAIAQTVRRLPRAVVSSFTETFNPSSTGTVLSVPGYREHLQDLLDTRQGLDSRRLMQQLFKQDPDVSAAVASYLTLADTPMRLFVRANGQIDQAATREAEQIFDALTRTLDYSQGFTWKPGPQTLLQELRYMVMLRGSIGGELVFDRQQRPNRIQQVDMASIEWFEPTSGQFKPRQKSRATGQFIDMDIVTFFVAFHRRDPTTPYSNSDFVSAINTIAARTQVINDLYRIMRMTGYPRIAIKVMEDVLRNNIPAGLKDDPVAVRDWMRDRLAEIAAQFTAIRVEQPFIHYDSAEVSIINNGRNGAELQIAEVIDTLNAQNQAGLKTMATVIGRGNSAATAASVEARIAAMNADQLNVPVKEFLEKVLTFALNAYGTAGKVEVHFDKAELRPHLELEPQRVMKASRLRQDLSLGLITDEEYHLEIYGRLPPEGAPVLMGTGFMTPDGGASVDVEAISPNSDPMGRSLAPAGSQSARSNTVRQAR